MRSPLTPIAARNIPRPGTCMNRSPSNPGLGSSVTSNRSMGQPRRAVANSAPVPGLPDHEHSARRVVGLDRWSGPLQAHRRPQDARDRPLDVGHHGERRRVHIHDTTAEHGLPPRDEVRLPQRPQPGVRPARYAAVGSLNASREERMRAPSGRRGDDRPQNARMCHMMPGGSPGAPPPTRRTTRPGTRGSTARRRSGPVG